MGDTPDPYVPTDQEVLEGRYKGDEIPSGKLPGASRMLGLFLLFLAALMAVAAFQNYDPNRTTNDFFLKKLGQPPVYDAVFVGDSRVVQGVNPEATGGKTFNFGFEGLGLSPKVLRDATGLLRPDGPKILAVALSVPSLDKGSQKSNGYTEVGHLNPVEGANLRAFGPAERFLTPNRITFDYTACRNDLGYAGADSVGQEGTREAAYDHPGYPKIDPAILEAVLAEFKKLKAAGFRVVAFRVPTSARMYKLETEKSGLNAADLAEKVRATGAEWIPGPPEPFKSRDGSHLSCGEAEMYSKWLGAQLDL